MSNNMTPQQAHKILNEYISLDSDLDNEFINALRVADKALQAEPLPEKCKDCIFRCTCGGKRANND